MTLAGQAPIPFPCKRESSEQEVAKGDTLSSLQDVMPYCQPRQFRCSVDLQLVFYL